MPILARIVGYHRDELSLQGRMIYAEAAAITFLRIQQTCGTMSQPTDRKREMQQFTLQAIGRVGSTRREANDDNWDRERSVVVLDREVFAPQATNGLEAFSHVEIIYLFDQVPDGAIETGARRPRNNPDWPEVGIVAQRGKNRPNRIGATVCRLLSVDGLTIQVAGLDAIDGTPVLDVKPVLSGFLPRSEVIEPAWAKEIMANYW
ncbi:MAG: SAM-dependent methyltransferase [Pseudomonadales bacterium]